MRGRLQASIVASTAAMLSLLVTPLSVFSSGAVALVTLRRGGREGLVILVWATIAAALLGAFLKVGYQFVLLYALFLWLPVWLIAIVLREGRHLSLAVEIAVLLGVVGVIAYYLYNADPAQMWREVMPKLVPSNVPVENVQRTLGLVSPYMTGIAAAGGVFGMLLGLFLGRWWQAMLFNPGGFKKEFLALRAEPRLAYVTIGIVVVGLLGIGEISEIAWNTLILLFVLFTCIGTSVSHIFLANTNIGNLAIPMFYITLFLIPHVILPVALVGLADTWLDIRNRKFKKT